MNHPIEEIMTTAMTNIKEMIDVDTIIGDSVVMGDGTVIIPVSRVSLGFVSGGGEYTAGKKPSSDPQTRQPALTSLPFPFAGGTGAGVSVSPVAFLVAMGGKVQLLPVESGSCMERILELVPGFCSDVKDLIRANAQKGKNAGSVQPPWPSPAADDPDALE